MKYLWGTVLKQNISVNCYPIVPHHFIDTLLNSTVNWLVYYNNNYKLSNSGVARCNVFISNGHYSVCPVVGRILYPQKSVMF